MEKFLHRSYIKTTLLKNLCPASASSDRMLFNSLRIILFISVDQCHLNKKVNSLVLLAFHLAVAAPLPGMNLYDKYLTIRVIKFGKLQSDIAVPCSRTVALICLDHPMIEMCD